MWEFGYFSILEKLPQIRYDQRDDNVLTFKNLSLLVQHVQSFPRDCSHTCQVFISCSNKEDQISQMESGNFSNSEKFPSVYLPYDDILNRFFLVLRCIVL